MTTPTELWAPFGLRVRCGPLELRAITDDDLPELADLALGGVHEPDRMPFHVAWTDAPPAGLPRNKPASIAVSRKVGYVDNGVDRLTRRGEMAWNRRFVLTPEVFVRPDEELQVDGVGPLRELIGLAGDATPATTSAAST